MTSVDVFGLFNFENRVLRRFVRGLALGATLCVAPLSPACAEPGVSPDAITFGQVAVLRGPAAALGKGMRAGILAAFAEAGFLRAHADRDLLDIGDFIAAQAEGIVGAKPRLIVRIGIRCRRAQK